MDEEGFFYIVDRKKDMIIAGGYNIYPREIDEVLYAHPKVRDAVAVGIPDPYRGETVKAFIVLKEGMTATAEDIIDYCRKNLAAYKVPRIIEFRDDLPKSMMGKVLRKDPQGRGDEKAGPANLMPSEIKVPGKVGWPIAAPDGKSGRTNVSFGVS